MNTFVNSKHLNALEMRLHMGLNKIVQIKDAHQCYAVLASPH